ncbi:MAG: dihydropyrimidinase, partial [Mobilitalea sp.]
MDILLKGGMVVSPEESKIMDVLIKGEIIARIGENLSAEGAKVIDVSGKLLFPGFIDTHTHFDLDAGTFFTADDFLSGSN